MLEQDQKEKTILIVEDDSVIVFYYQMVLKTFGFKLLFAGNGKEGVDTYKENPSIDLVLMDVRMPIMNGIDATKHILDFDKNAKVIIQSAYSSNSDVETYKSIGSVDFLPKPISKDHLVEKLNKWL